MFKVLLINSNRFKQPWPVIPFGLCYIASCVEEAGYTVEVLDLTFTKNCPKDIAQAVDRFKPDVVGISIRNIDNATGYNTQFLLDPVNEEVIKPCKKVFTGPIIIGGPAVGISGKEMLHFFDLSYAICGDGELAMLEFLAKVKNKEDLEGIPGLIIRRNEEIIIAEEPYMVNDLDSLPFPRPYKYINVEAYRRFDSPLLIQTKRGCPLNCTYCTYNRIEGKRYRLRSPDLIVQEIEELVRETKITHIEFTDSVFNIPLNHAKNVLKAIIKKGLKLRLRTMGINPGGIDEELVDLMQQAGFTDVDFGAEAMSNIALQGLGKNFTREDVFRSAKLLHERNISLQWTLLIGAPGETEETIQKTIEAVMQSALPNWDLVDVGIVIRAYKGAPISEFMKAENENCTDDNFLHPVHYEPSQVNLQKMKILVKRASFKYPNIFMYDEDETTPAFVLRFGIILLRLFRQEVPVWKLFILLRKIEMITGVRKIKHWLWEQKIKRS